MYGNSFDMFEGLFSRRSSFGGLGGGDVDRSSFASVSERAVNAEHTVSDSLSSL